MKLTFLEHIHKRDYEANLLAEKQIVYGTNQNYGQIVFLAGGAGSGKGFAIDNFMHGEKFKVRDVDELKIAFMKMDELHKFTMEDLITKYKDQIPPADMQLINDVVVSRGLSLKNLDLKKPEHVYALHVLVRATGAKDKTLDLILDGAKKTTLPNIIFDTTFADMSDLNKYVPRLMEIGYDPKSIHITWILTNYEIAIKNNAKRARVVPSDILLKTHIGAARTVFSLVAGTLPRNVDGGFYVVLNNPENTLFIVDPKTGEHYKDIKGKRMVSNFTYLTLKKPGKAMTTESDIKKQLFDWIRANVPAEALNTAEIDKQL